MNRSINNFIEYFNANRAIKCSEKVFEEVIDNILEDPFEG